MRYSNFHHSLFCVSGKPFECNEQCFCHGKAIFFKDYETAEKILCEPDPGKQKQLARNVKNFDKMVWFANADNIMATRLNHKFDQNPDLKKKRSMNQNGLGKIS